VTIVAIVVFWLVFTAAHTALLAHRPRTFAVVRVYVRVPASPAYVDITLVRHRLEAP
jgi:hypothetical protein